MKGAALSGPVGKRSGPAGQPGHHVDATPQVRIRKAHKVGRIIERLARRPSGRALDLGCGAGYVAQRLSQLGWRAAAVDVADYRTVFTDDFVRARSEVLPFRSGSFHLVVSNHVIEHVPDALAHLREVARVLAPGAVAYVSTPNRLWPLEPHYKLPFLSWLPRPLADSYVRLCRRGTFFDVYPLTGAGLARLAAQAGLERQDVTSWLISETGEVERSWMAALAARIPPRLLHWLSWASPTVALAVRPAQRRDDRG